MSIGNMSQWRGRQNESHALITTILLFNRDGHLYSLLSISTKDVFFVLTAITGVKHVQFLLLSLDDRTSYLRFPMKKLRRNRLVKSDRVYYELYRMHHSEN